MMLSILRRRSYYYIADIGDDAMYRYRRNGYRNFCERTTVILTKFRETLSVSLLDSTMRRIQDIRDITLRILRVLHDEYMHHCTQLTGEWLPSSFSSPPPLPPIQSFRYNMHNHSFSTVHKRLPDCDPDWDFRLFGAKNTPRFGHAFPPVKNAVSR